MKSQLWRGLFIKKVSPVYLKRSRAKIGRNMSTRKTNTQTHSKTCSSISLSIIVTARTKFKQRIESLSFRKSIRRICLYQKDTSTKRTCHKTCSKKVRGLPSRRPPRSSTTSGGTDKRDPWTPRNLSQIRPSLRTPNPSIELAKCRRMLTRARVETYLTLWSTNA